MTTGSGLDLPALLEVAGSILDGVSGEFVAGLGAPSAVVKGLTDFATQVDLDLEQRIRRELTDRTGINVHGEEFGGPPVTDGAVWVLDPVDGTYNYSTGMPLTGILLGLLVDGEAVLGLTWLPLTGLRYAGHVGGPLYRNGVPMAAHLPTTLAQTAVAFGPFNVSHGGRYPGARRAQLLEALSVRAARLRMTGSTGVDMAYVASGIFGAAIAFGAHAWDNAAGAALVRAAGGLATDLAGNPWTASSPSLVTAMPDVHRELMAVIDDVGVWSGSDITSTTTDPRTAQHGSPERPGADDRTSR
ncbi:MULTISPECIES: inositol monophosphatase family protein [Gordonia]|uniref:inositol-phosphate phosphatase n=1 Tax=Gordonia sputi NBRC 100414 TaxID=1089453 RepID=H5U668_9ACTN|nr:MULTISPECIES: inositol monophosphatase [Gordonia]NKY94711.1 inositol monophosphatase [Gordonia sputi]OBA62126.1 inositol monophosphatase [Gordonia sp. 852002-10350_SCH5691597]GAB41226.1 inositol monophosphatase ImpA [Gordonia sputi NBRC 100414]